MSTLSNRFFNHFVYVFFAVNSPHLLEGAPLMFSLKQNHVTHFGDDVLWVCGHRKFCFAEINFMVRDFCVHVFRVYFLCITVLIWAAQIVCWNTLWTPSPILRSMINFFFLNVLCCATMLANHAAHREGQHEEDGDTHPNSFVQLCDVPNNLVLICCWWFWQCLFQSCILVGAADLQELLQVDG